MINLYEKTGNLENEDDFISYPEKEMKTMFSGCLVLVFISVQYNLTKQQHQNMSTCLNLL